MNAAFVVTDLSYRYRRAERLALDGIEIAAERGRVLGLLGPNGCGKTTLIRILASTLRTGRGSARLFPDDAASSPDKGRRRVAACFDRVPLLEALSGRENAIRLTGLRGVGHEEAARRVDHWLSVFGLATRAADAAGTYSLGMRRKLALTEAFAARADLLLLDEPLGGLDAEGKAALLASLRDERERGAAAVVAVHDPDFAAAACDTVVLMDGGRVLTHGAPAALIESLALETTFEVTLATPADSVRAAPGHPGAEGPGQPSVLAGVGLPDGVRILGATPEGVRLASTRGAEALPETAAAIVEAGGLIRAIHVREPDLDDVFASLTGRTMSATRSAPA